MQRLPVQKRPVEGRELLCRMLPDFSARDQFQFRDDRSSAVQAIAKNRVSHVREVQSDLVSASRFGQCPHVGEAGESFNYLVNCGGRASVRVFAANRLFITMRRMVADRFIDPIAIELRRTDDDCQVFFFHDARLELLGQRIVRLIGLGDDNDAARVAIQPVHDAWARRTAASAEGREVVGQCARQRTLPMALRRVNDHPGRLVDDDDRVVLVQNLQRNVLRRGTFTRHVDLRDSNALATAQTLRRLAWIVVDSNMPCFNRSPNCRSADARKLSCEQHVKSLTGVIGRDGEQPRKLRRCQVSAVRCQGYCFEDSSSAGGAA